MLSQSFTQSSLDSHRNHHSTSNGIEPVNSHDYAAADGYLSSLSCRTPGSYPGNIPPGTSFNQYQNSGQTRDSSHDQTITPRNIKRLAMEENNRLGLGQMFEQATKGPATQELQPEWQKMAQQDSISDSLKQQSDINIAPRQEHGITIEQIDALMASGTDTFDELFDSRYVPNNMGTSHTFDFATSAECLDSFGDRKDNYMRDLHVNEEMALQDISPNGCVRPYSCDVNNHAETTRPATPKYQNAPGQFPTPDTSPNAQQAQPFRFQRSMEPSTRRCDSQLTIKASQSMQRGTSYPDNFSAMRQHPISPTPSPPHTAPLRPRASIDIAAFPPPTAEFLNMSDLRADFPSTKGRNRSFDCSPLMTRGSSQSSVMSSFRTSPEEKMVQSFQSTPETAMLQSFESSPEMPNMLLPTYYGASQAGHTQPRAQSISSNDANHDAREDLEGFSETNITAEEVAAFMSGPDESNSWYCLYEGCSKTKFSRKENVKSHIQTHLGDRKYFCKACNERFVRPHDLKRHVRSHKKGEYVCECLKDFPRMDALQRHKTRECCPAHPKSPKKDTVKRGRPRKTRPDTEERRAKAAKTRERVLQRKGPQYASSISTVSSPSPTLGATMSRQESEHSHYSTPPELDLSNSSPMTTSYPDFFAGDLADTDFSLAPSLAKNIDTNDSLFGEYLELDENDNFFANL